jgi:stage II sporulation protein AA (anti-sigma F factor antagonist)
MRDFEVAVEVNVSGGTLVQVTGELDLATCGELEAALQAADLGTRVVIDLTACDFLDSSGLRVLMAGAGRSESAGGRVVLVAPDPRIRRVLELTGIDAKVSVHETREDALAS